MRKSTQIGWYSSAPYQASRKPDCWSHARTGSTRYSVASAVNQQGGNETDDIPNILRLSILIHHRGKKGDKLRGKPDGDECDKGYCRICFQGAWCFAATGEWNLPTNETI